MCAVHDPIEETPGQRRGWGEVGGVGVALTDGWAAGRQGQMSQARVIKRPQRAQQGGKESPLTQPPALQLICTMPPTCGPGPCLARGGPWSGPG